MPNEPVELIRSAFEAAARVRDPSGRRLDVLDPETVAAAFDFFDEDIELREDPRFPEGGHYRGMEAVRAYFEQFTQSFDEFVLEDLNPVPVGPDRVLLEFRGLLRGRESGAAIEIRPGWIYTVRGDRVVAIEAYLDREEARAAVGLSG